jgi:hypothetical protein
MENPVKGLVDNLINEIKEDMVADYKTTEHLNETYVYWIGFIGGLNKRGIFTEDEITSLHDLNRNLFLKLL